MTISLFGASGRTGLQILKIANKYYPDYKFKVLVRNKDNLNYLRKVII